MSKSLILYYSRSGNNKYLAEKIKEELKGDVEVIRPSVKNFPYLVTLNLLGLPAGIEKLKHDPSQYDLTVLCGPIWMGNLIPPLKGVVKKYNRNINNLAFATCCGSGDDERKGKFGTEQVFKKIKDIVGDKLSATEMFSIHLLVPEEQKNDKQALMKVRLNDQTYKGLVKERVEKFLFKLKSLNI